MWMTFFHIYVSVLLALFCYIYVILPILLIDNFCRSNKHIDN